MTARSFALRLAAVVVLVAGLSARPTLAQDRHQVERAYQDLARSVVRIGARYASIFAPPGAGSGVVISDDGLIATADHVIDGAAEVWVDPGGAPQRAEIIRRARERDLALIRVEAAGGLAPIEPRGRPLRPGQCVLALGSVMNWGIGIFAGIVSLPACAEGCPAQAGRILTDIATPPGLSGGALVACDDRSLARDHQLRPPGAEQLFAHRRDRRRGSGLGARGAPDRSDRLRPERSPVLLTTAPRDRWRWSVQPITRDLSVTLAFHPSGSTGRLTMLAALRWRFACRSGGVSLIHDRPAASVDQIPILC